MNEEEIRRLVGIGASDQAGAGTTDLARQIASATNAYRAELGDGFTDAEKLALMLTFQNSFVTMLTELAKLMTAKNQPPSGA